MWGRGRVARPGRESWQRIMKEVDGMDYSRRRISSMGMEGVLSESIALGPSSSGNSMYLFYAKLLGIVFLSSNFLSVLVSTWSVPEKAGRADLLSTFKVIVMSSIIVENSLFMFLLCCGGVECKRRKKNILYSHYSQEKVYMVLSDRK